jgi:hypothetical protein
MNSRIHKAPGEAEGDGQARHGGRTEVNWDGGKGRQPYANQGEEERESGAAGEFEAGDRGDASGSNLEQAEQASRKP